MRSHHSSCTTRVFPTGIPQVFLKVAIIVGFSRSIINLYSMRERNDTWPEQWMCRHLGTCPECIEESYRMLYKTPTNPSQEWKIVKFFLQPLIIEVNITTSSMAGYEIVLRQAISLNIIKGIPILFPNSDIFLIINLLFRILLFHLHSQTQLLIFTVFKLRILTQN